METKNALRKHYVAEINKDDPSKEPAGAEWLWLAKGITTVDDDSDEKTDSSGFYDGDGTENESVTSVRGGYSFKGYYHRDDPAQKLIASKKFLIGEGRNVWHKVVAPDGKEEQLQIGTVSDITAGAGDATEYEDFKCTIKWIKVPVTRSVTKEE